MKQAVFLKYKPMDINEAKRKNNSLCLKCAKPINYNCVLKRKCSNDVINNVLLYGNLQKIPEIKNWGLQSTVGEDGYWNCINLYSEEYSILVYTSGTSEVLYLAILSI